MPRFTPTCVGTMLWGKMKDYSETVHPHVRGDNQDRNKSDL
ncbi:hypothetical protein PITCH_A50044 [uncultured Desulfobacterium sp.]|uniref:Uncharacterized protein n=1 Tax=uncultured Desulfobacterium sp. TaxID=201089 RepID=A0A445N0W3_9BACT|nr:hypothetical protein PITCH_A50044 [uncultured Desulfobacterium sp.]